MTAIGDRVIYSYTMHAAQFTILVEHEVLSVVEDYPGRMVADRTRPQRWAIRDGRRASARLARPSRVAGLPTPTPGQLTADITLPKWNALTPVERTKLRNEGTRMRADLDDRVR